MPTATPSVSLRDGDLNNYILSQFKFIEVTLVCFVCLTVDVIASSDVYMRSLLFFGVQSLYEKEDFNVPLNRDVNVTKKG